MTDVVSRGSDRTGSILAQVRNWWNETPCGTQNTSATPLSRTYFDEIEAHRYSQEPFIFSLAQFTRHRGQRVLEVGVGAGTDFAQWVRAGAHAHGVDLTQAAIDHVRARLQLEGLTADDLRTGNAEALDYPDGYFDVVYSWGVLHHSPSISRAVSEVVRVLRPGGTGKLMLYNRHSLTAFYIWLKWAVLTGHPFRSISYCLAHFVESPDTKAVTRAEVERLLHTLGVTPVSINSVLTYQDRLEGYPRLRPLGSILSRLVDSSRRGWFLLVEFRKPG
jgi:ubiquinone/menaquinone biosynthesis C-methylase UbiE